MLPVTEVRIQIITFMTWISMSQSGYVGFFLEAPRKFLRYARTLHLKTG